MAQIGIQSEAFLSLYKTLQPALDRLDRQRQGFQRSMTVEMPAFFPEDVRAVLHALGQQAERGIALAGSGNSQVLLDDRQIGMIEWVKTQGK